MINFTTVEKEYIIEWLQERSNECYECASGNWFRDPTPEQRAEFRNEANLCDTIVEKLKES